MKAILWTKYGPPEVLELGDIEMPAPADGDVLICNRATTVTAGDCEMRAMKFPFYLSLPLRLWLGLWKPRAGTIPGSEFAGEVVAVGRAVTRFKTGDAVFGATGLKFGANAEYVCLPETSAAVEGALAVKPANMSFEEAATVPFGGRDSLHFLRKANLQPGQKILINGAGGSIGVFAVQLARHFGAEVTAVDHGSKLDLLRALGADRVLDYTREDFSRTGAVYDVIFDIVGKASLARSRKALRPGGTFLLANPGPAQIFQGLLARWAGTTKVVLQPAAGTTDDLNYLRELIEAGKLRTTIDRTFPLAEIRAAHRYVESGAKKGNIVLTF